MSSHSPPQCDTDDEAQRRLIVERVRKRVRLSKAKRALQTRLGLASFKASRGWQDISFADIEPHLLRTARAQSEAAWQRAGGSQGSPPDGALRTPERHWAPVCRSEPTRSRTLSHTSTPDLPVSYSPQPGSQPRSLLHPPAHPRTPEQLIRSKWTSAHSRCCETPRERERREDEQHDIADQTTAAELMLFLATGSPSPDHRLSSTGSSTHCSTECGRQ